MNAGFIRKSDTRAVLQGNPGAGQNGLALGKQERLGLAIGLLGTEPLESLGVRAGFVPNRHGIGSRYGLFREDEQFRSQYVILAPGGKAQNRLAKAFARSPNVLNIQPIRVQAQGIRFLAVKGQGRQGLQHVGIKIHRSDV